MVDLAAVRKRAEQILTDYYGTGEQAGGAARNLARDALALVKEFEATLAANASLVEINDRLEDEHIILTAERDSAIDAAESRLETIRELSGLADFGRTT